MTNNHEYHFETGPIRPPSEGGSFSLLVRVTRNCPWNRCGFCRLYRGSKFEIRTVEDVISDIDTVASIKKGIEQISIDMDTDGLITRDSALKFLNRVPELQTSYWFSMVYDWLMSGAKTVFLQDANILILPVEKLVEILRYLKHAFPSIERITSYARAKTLSKKKPEDLAVIQEAGLDRLHIGLESGDDGVLSWIKKGVTSEGQIRGGKNAREAGFQISEYWIPGLGGMAMSENHAKNTARVLNSINPHYIRTRPCMPLPGTDLFNALERGEFQPLALREQLLEIKLMIESLDVTSRVCFDHYSNGWVGKNCGLLFSQSYEGYQFPDEKPKILELIEEGMALN